jgi:MFS family permease
MSPRSNDSPPAESQAFTLRSLVWSVYIPTFLFSIGQGAVLPVIPLFALDLGASAAAAGLVVGMRGLGLMFLDLPSGVAVSRFGDKGAMVAGTAIVAIVAVGAPLTRSVTMLGLLIFFMGGGWSFWQIARLAHLTEVVPVGQRGRALSLVGGVNRAGNFVGPILGGYLGKYYGLESAFYAQAVMGIAAAVMMFLVVRTSSGLEELSGHGIGRRLSATVSEHRRIFLSAGFAVVVLQILRQGRPVFLPLWGNAIGLDVAEIGLAIGVSSFLDTWLFYPVGHLVDRRGRKWASIPSLVTMSLGFLLLPRTTEFIGFALVAVLIGIGNGFGAGIVQVLGADFAPTERRGEFLGVWRFISDVGVAAGPLAVSAIVGLASLGLASALSACLGLVGAVVMGALVPETLQRRPDP